MSIQRGMNELMDKLKINIKVLQQEFCHLSY